MDNNELELKYIKDAIDKLEKAAEKSLDKNEKELEIFEQALEKRFDEYVLKIVFENLKERIDDRIKPLERLVYGMVGLVLLSVLTAVIATVVVQ